MPEVTVDKDGYMGGRKDNVRAAKQGLDVLAETHSAFVQCRPNHTFKRGILALYASHTVASLLWG